MEGEDTVEVTDLQHASHPRFGHNHQKIAVKQPDPLERTNKHADAEAVDEVDAAEVEHQTVPAVLDRVHDCLSQFGRADDVEFPGHGEHGPVALDMGAHIDLHAADGIGRQACDSVTPLS